MTDKSKTLTLIRDAARKQKASRVDPLIADHEDTEAKFLCSQFLATAMPRFDDDESAVFEPSLRQAHSGYKAPGAWK